MSDKIIITVSNGKQYTFDSRDSCLIGRSSDCKIAFNNEHSSISRYHCLLDINPPQVCIRDLGSRHGTYVNNQLIGKREENHTPEEGVKLKLPQHPLQDGDEIRIDNIVFQVSIHSQPAPPTLKLKEAKTTFKIPPIGYQAVKKKKNFNLWDFIVGLFQRAEAGESNLEPIKGYTLMNKLGEGGFGEVYLARNNKTEELVALKLMLPEVAAQPKMVEMFLREARNAKMLNHPNLVPLKDYCFADGVFFFTMEYCPYGTVSSWMKKLGRKLSIEEAIPVILQVLDGLHYAHTEKKLVHRDIKPQNIFLTMNDEGETIAKLGDYGLAKGFDVSGLSGFTLTGTCIGTPEFMPRQQVLNFKYVQPDVDVWAVAATLYFMITGKFPRNLRGIDSFMAIRKINPIPIRYQDKTVPQPLAELIDLALQEKPEIHFQNALAFKNALLSVVSLR